MHHTQGGCACPADHDDGKNVGMGGASTWLAVAAGGALGSVARFWLTVVMTALTGPRFPWGTLLINVLGSFVIGLVAALTLVPDRIGMHPDLRVFLMVGVCGGFTTFSAFSLQTLELLQSGDSWSAAGYVLGSVVCCLAAVWCGWLIGKA
jgi:CrcB protein